MTFLLTQSYGTNTTVTYVNKTQQGAVLNSLIIDATSSSTMTLSQAKDALSAGAEDVGYNGNGIFIQRGGTNTVTGNLSLGAGTSSNGTYTLSGTGVLQADNEYVGNYGTGTFTQTGGTNTVSGGLYLNCAFDPTTGSWLPAGAYTLSGGALQASNEYIGYGGNGIFTQSGGTNTVTGDLSLEAGTAGTYGTYSLTGGTPAVQGNITGGTGTGTINVDGGTLTINGSSVKVTNFNVGYSSGSNGAFTMDNITLTAGNENIGYNGTGIFTQTAGTNTVTGDLSLGVNSGDSQGIYNLTGGTLDVRGNITGGDGTSTVNIDGGSLTNKWSSIYVTSFNVGYSSGSNGGFAMDSKNLTADNEYIGWSGAGTFIQTGGTNTVNGGLYLGYNYGSNGTYMLWNTGALQADNEYVGSHGAGAFTQSGGTNTVANTLSLGLYSDGKGTYKLSGTGALQAPSKTSAITAPGHSPRPGGPIRSPPVFLLGTLPAATGLSS